MVLAAVGQLCSTNSMDHNLAQCEKLVKQAASKGAKALFLPEAADYIGSSKEESLSLAKTLDQSPFLQGLCKLASEYSLPIQVGVHEQTDPPSERAVNSLIWIDAHGRLPGTDVNVTDDPRRYMKLHLFNIDLSKSGGEVMKEEGTTKPGKSISPVYDSPVGKTGSQICFDLRYPEPAIRLRREGAQIITYPSAFTYATGAMGHWEILLRARAIESQCYIFAAAQCGRHNKGRVSYGDSMIVDPRGQILGRLSKVEDAESEKENSREPELLVVDVDLGEIKTAREAIPLERRTDVYAEV